MTLGTSWRTSAGEASANPVSITDLGFTGPNGTEIGAFFGPLPPVATAGGSAVLFQYYGVPEPIPTSELLPCGGSGRVNFVPLPLLPGARLASVPVEFVGQP